MEKQFVVPVPVIVKENKILLGFKHKSSVKHCINKWELMGGRIKFGQDFEEALKTKTKKSLGVDIETNGLLGNVYSSISKTVDDEHEVQMFIIPVKCTLLGEKFSIDETKYKEVRWFTYQEIEELHRKDELVDENDLHIAKTALDK